MTNWKLLDVPRFDGEAKFEEYIKSIGVPATFFEVGFYMPDLEVFLNKIRSLSI